MNFKNYLHASSQEITSYASSFFTEWREKPENKIPQLDELQTLFADRMVGGKMIRGTLVRLGYALHHGEDLDSIMRPALAIEILHSSLLIHDDIMDLSQMRRGKPSVYQVLGASKHGISQAICLGDLGFFLSMHLLAQSQFASEPKNKALAALSKIITETVFGQMLDAELSQTASVSEKEVMLQYKLKTAYYSIVSPLSIGGILAGASDDWLLSVKKFGEYLGIAYQIQDDILGVFGDEAVLGKSTSSDIEEGKRTVLFAYCLSHGSPEHQEIIKNLYGKGKLTEEEQLLVKKVLIESGSLLYSRSLLKRYSDKAKKLIPSLTLDTQMQALVTSLIEILIERDR